jgi:hypothetical protein
MLANYRCNEIREQVISEQANKIMELLNDSTLKLINDFKPRCQEIINYILEGYDKMASNYDSKIYLDIRRQTETDLSNRFYICFLNQMRRLMPMSQKFVRQDLQKQLSATDDFHNLAMKLRKQYLSDFNSKLEEKKVYDDWLINDNELQEIIDEVISNQRKLTLNEKKTKLVQGLKEEIEEAFRTRMESYDKDFWTNVNRDYFTYVYAKMLPMRRYLTDFFKISDDEFFGYAEEVENELYNAVRKEFTKKNRDLPDKAVEFFRKDFWFENDIQRNWNKIKDEDIDALFKTCRAKYLDLIDNLKLFKLLKAPLKCTIPHVNI